MKRLLGLCTVFMMSANCMLAGNALEIKDITAGKYRAVGIGSVTALSDGESFAKVSKDGKRIIRYSFKTGKELSVVFDVANTIGESVDAFEDYIMSPDASKILIQTKSEKIYRRSFTATYYIYDVKSRRLEKLSDRGPQRSPVWSPDGNEIAFVRDNNIFLVKLLYDNAESQVTKDGKYNEIINGVPDWVNEEEFGFSTALTFTSDSKMICWIKYDETDVPQYSLQMFKGEKPERNDFSTYPGLYSYKYPKAGEKNSNVEVYSYDIQSRQVRKLQVPLDVDGYIPRIKMLKNTGDILVYTLNRHQNVLSLYSTNPRTTVSKLLLKEQNDKYVPEEVVSGINTSDNYILVPSDRDGFTQLYLYNMTGSLVRKVTNGKFDVTDVYGYDEATGNTYYQAAGKDPMNRELYVTNKFGKTTCLTDRKGWNGGTFSSDYRYFINCWSDANTPYEYSAYTSNGSKLNVIIDNAELKDKLSTLNLSSREFFKFTTSDGVELNGIMLKPHNFESDKKYPVIMWQYSGPGSQQVINSWGLGSVGAGALFDDYLTEKGFIAVCVDGRGTGGRGADFMKCTYLRLGEMESKDQVEAAIYLGALSYVDKSRIGIWGWSFGGFNTLMSMCEGRNVFKSGVAVAPPTDWRFYDTIYTERYMRTPNENKSGYDINPINRVSEMNGSLLLCHGLADDNVHPQNMFEYTESLVQADKDFKMNIYTNRNHSIYGGNTRNHLLRQIADFFADTLK